MRSFAINRLVSLCTMSTLALTGCGSGGGFADHTSSLRGEKQSEKNDSPSSDHDNDSSLTNDKNNLADTKTQNKDSGNADTGSPQGSDTDPDSRLPTPDGKTPDTAQSRCKLPVSELALLDWGSPTGNGGNETPEILKNCGFDSNFAICAFGPDLTTNALSVLGCEEFNFDGKAPTSPDGTNSKPSPESDACQKLANKKTQDNTDKKINHYSCVETSPTARP